MLLSALFGKSEAQKSARSIYDLLAGQSRNSEFYLSFRVPDTLEGRFEMIVLHLFLFLQRLKVEQKENDETGKLVLETFFSELDGSLREMGVGDLAVPKRMRKLADSFYGRIYSYSAALEKNDGATLEKAIADNIYGHLNDDDQAADLSVEIAAMAGYVRDAYSAICSNSLENCLKGEIIFIHPVKAS